MIQHPTSRNRLIDSSLQGSVAGILAGGSSGIATCCLSSAVRGAVMAISHWHEFHHPLGAILASAAYLGCLALPVGLLLAVPGGLLLGGLAGYCQAIGKKTWPGTIAGTIILFGLCESLNLWFQTKHPHWVLLPGEWQQHLAALLGVSLGVDYWSRQKSAHHGYSSH